MPCRHDWNTKYPHGLLKFRVASTSGHLPPDGCKITFPSTVTSGPLHLTRRLQQNRVVALGAPGWDDASKSVPSFPQWEGCSRHTVLHVLSKCWCTLAASLGWWSLNHSPYYSLPYACKHVSGASWRGTFTWKCAGDCCDGFSCSCCFPYLCHFST